MPYKAAKISFDGSHYIATPKENFPQGHKRRRTSLPPTPKELEQKAQFEAAYKESQQFPRKERKACMQAVREDFIRHNAELANQAIKSTKKELQVKRKRTEELSRLMQVAYEDRVRGKMPEDICIGFIQKYSDEQKKLETEIAELEAKLTETENTMQSADVFIRNIKKYLEAPELTREMCYELIDRIIVGGLPKITGKEREIDIVYKVDIASVLRHKLNK